MTRWVEIDFETASTCDLKKAGAWRYAEDPTTEILCLGYQAAEIREPTVLTPTDLTFHEDRAAHLWELVNDPEVIFVAHNCVFEKAIWRRIMVEQYSWPDIPNKRWHDSMAVCAMRAIPMDLDRACMILRLSEQKDMEGSKLTKNLSKPNRKGYFDRSEATLQRVYQYNGQDLRSQVELHKRIGWLPPGERNVWLLDQRINERGVYLDTHFIASCKSVVEQATVPLMKEFQTITGIPKLGSPKVAEWVKSRAEGIHLPNMRKETIEALLGEDEDDDDTSNAGEATTEEMVRVALPDDVRRALSIRRLIGSASVKKLPAMEACVCSDSRVRGAIQYHGTGTGRWAGRLFQPQNFPRGTIHLDLKAPDPSDLKAAINTRDPDYVEMLYAEYDEKTGRKTKGAVDVVLSALRHSIIAPKGKLLVVGDYASIEARVVLALAGQHDKCALLASGADAYIDMACDIFDLPRPADKDGIKKFKLEHSEERGIGKNTILGCGFGMGWKKFRMRYCPNKPPEFAQQAIDTYRKTWAPEVPKLWKALEEASLETVLTGQPHEAYGVLYQREDRWLTARLPSARKLWYFNPQATKKHMPWSTEEDPDVRMIWTYQAKKLGQIRTIDAYGGLETENVVQALARDLLAAALIKLETQTAMDPVMSVHDEAINEVEESKADAKELEQVLCDSPPWARMMKVPVQAECWAGPVYKKG